MTDRIKGFIVTLDKDIREGLDDIIKQAQQLLKLINPQQASQGKYNIQIGEAKGVVIGDQAQVTQNFGKE